MNKEQAIKNLIDVQEAFPNGFLAYGSALGAHRENDIISHDLDTDFGVFSDEFAYTGINILIRKGFSLVNVFGMRHYGMEMSVARGGVKTDIMVIYKYANNSGRHWNALWDNGGRNGLEDAIIHEYKKGVFDEKKLVKLGGHDFNYFGEKYIEAVYGEDWLTPVTPWNWRTDHKCLKQDE